MRPIDAEPLEEILRSRCAQYSDDYGSLAGAINGCLKLLQAQPTIAPPPNDPLTMEELREMEGEPVWCESEHRPDGSGWFLVDASALQPHEFIAIGRERGIPCAGIDTGYWLAYRRKPEEGTA